MAKDVITRFKLETTGFDSKIRQAAKELSNYSKTATQAKEGFNQFTKANVDAAKALGTMATSTTNVKDRAKELVGAFNDAAKAYNALSDEQKQSDWAKALSGSLTQLQKRIKETKDEMQGLGNSKGGMGGGMGGNMSGMLQVFGGNLMTKGVETGISAAKSLAVSMKDTVQQGVELSKSAEGVRLAFERINRPDLLDKLKEATHGTVSELELMRQAVKFKDFNLNLDEMGTLLAFAQQKAKDTGQSVDYMVDSIVTGLGRQSLMILDNLGLSATAVKEKMKETGDMTSAVAAIIKEQMSEAGGYVETAADRGAKSIADLENATLHLGDSFRETFGYEGIDEMSTVMETRLIQDFTTLIQSVDTLSSALSSMGVDGNAALNALADTAYALMTGPLGILLPMISESSKTYAANGGTAGTGGHIIERHEPTKPVVTPKKRGGGGKRTTQEKTEEQENSEQIQKLAREFEKASEDRRKAIQNEIKALQQRNAEIKYYQDMAMGKDVRPMEAKVDTSGMGVGISNYSKVEDALKEKLDTSAIITPLQALEDELKRITEIQQLAWSPEQFASYQKKIEEITGKINEFKGIKQVGKDWQAAGTAIQAVGSAMSQIEDPAAKVMGTIAQAIATIALTFAKSLEKTFTPWDWIAAAAAGTATMISTISAIHSATGYANGGMVKGNSYSGDNIPAIVDGSELVGLNAGEIVLNAAQSSNVASNLQASGGNVHVTGQISGEQILLVANRTTKRQGKGELVTWK